VRSATDCLNYPKSLVQQEWIRVEWTHYKWTINKCKFHASLRTKFANYRNNDKIAYSHLRPIVRTFRNTFIRHIKWNIWIIGMNRIFLFALILAAATRHKL
jgi:hypothetical protein